MGPGISLVEAAGGLEAEAEDAEDLVRGGAGTWPAAALLAPAALSPAAAAVLSLSSCCGGGGVARGGAGASRGTLFTSIILRMSNLSPDPELEPGPGLCSCCSAPPLLGTAWLPEVCGGSSL